MLSSCKKSFNTT